MPWRTINRVPELFDAMKRRIDEQRLADKRSRKPNTTRLTIHEAYSVRECSEEAGIGYMVLSRWVNDNVTRADFDMANQLAEFFGEPVIIQVHD